MARGAYVSRSPWRQRALLVLAQVLQATETATPAERRRALRLAYPFGPRVGWPYKVWLDQLARMQGRRPPLGTRKRSGVLWDPRQLSLFSG